MSARRAKSLLPRGGVAALVAITLVAGGFLSACDRSESCTPRPLELSSTSATVGGHVTISSPAASCRVDRAASHRYSVVLHDVSGTAFPIGSAPVTDHGQFTLTFELPATVQPGPAELSVLGSTVDCQQSGSCPGYGAALTITSTS
jgi:hypothetical protein